MSGKTESIQIRKGLCLYKQPLGKGRGSPNWYARVYMPIGGRENHTKSTGTTDQRDATKKAEAFWGECLMWRQGGGGSPGSTGPKTKPELRFDRVAESWLENRKLDAGSDPRRLRNVKDCQSAYFAKNGFAAFFGREDITTITTDRIRDFLRFQIEKSRNGKLASASQKRSLVVLNQILKHAYDQRLIYHLPRMPKIALQRKPRGWFNKEEYRQLYTMPRVMARKALKNGDQQEHDRWVEMADFVVFMVNCFLRPSEWADLRHRHITVHNGSDGTARHLEIAVVKGKTGQRVVASMPRAVAVYERMVAQSGNDPDGFLFKFRYLNRQTAKERMRDQFEILLRATGLKTDKMETKRPLYSLRHTSLMYRILEGDNVDHLVLAKNAGTSIDQLERHYLSHLKAGMMLANLHSFKPKKR